MSFYTYVHIRQDTDKVFYVGKGAGNRAYSCKDRNKHWRHVDAKCGRRVEIAGLWKTETEALDHEKFLISCFRDLGHPLVNYTDGGEGISGYRHTDDAKRRIAEANIGIKRPYRPQSPEQVEKRASKHRGIPRPDSVKAAVSAARKGQPNGRLGTRHSPETIAKIRANSVGWKHTPEQIEKMKQAWVRRKEKLARASA